VSPAKTAEPIKIPFGLWTGVGVAVCAAAANILSASLQPNRAAAAAADIGRRAPPICGSDVDFFPVNCRAPVLIRYVSCIHLFL